MTSSLNQKHRLTFALGFLLCLISETAAAKALRIVYTEGYMTCKLSNQEPVYKFLEITKNHPDARVYWGCFDDGFVGHPKDWSERFFLYTIEPNGKWSKPTEMLPRTAPQEISKLIGKELQALKAQSPSDSSDDKLMDLFVAGHSHGGWMAMRMAYQLSFQSRAQIQEFLTIDPVSFDLCHSALIPVHGILKTVNWWGDTSDCQRSPRDLEKIEPYIAAAVQNRWTNIYQTTTPFLFSGPVKGASVNKIFYAPNQIDRLLAHSLIKAAPSTWSDFYKSLEATVKLHKDRD